MSSFTTTQGDGAISNTIVGESAWAKKDIGDGEVGGLYSRMKTTFHPLKSDTLEEAIEKSAQIVFTTGGEVKPSCIVEKTGAKGKKSFEPYFGYIKPINPPDDGFALSKGQIKEVEKTDMKVYKLDLYDGDDHFLGHLLEDAISYQTGGDDVIFDECEWFEDASLNPRGGEPYEVERLSKHGKMCLLCERFSGKCEKPLIPVEKYSYLQAKEHKLVHICEECYVPPPPPVEKVEEKKVIKIITFKNETPEEKKARKKAKKAEMKAQQLEHEAREARHAEGNWSESSGDEE